MDRLHERRRYGHDRARGRRVRRTRPRRRGRRVPRPPAARGRSRRRSAPAAGTGSAGAAMTIATPTRTSATAVCSVCGSPIPSGWGQHNRAQGDRAGAEEPHHRARRCAHGPRLRRAADQQIQQQRQDDGLARDQEAAASAHPRCGLRGRSRSCPARATARRAGRWRPSACGPDDREARARACP